MVKSADTADLKSADLNRSWGFKSPSGHHRIVGFRWYAALSKSFLTNASPSTADRGGLGGLLLYRRSSSRYTDINR